MKQIVIDSPVGELRLLSDGEALAGVHFAGHGPTSGIEPAASGDPLLAEAARQLGEWFAGTRRRFDLPLAPRGTEFQRAVWRALVEIEFGEHCSYADVARAVGKPTASRAVGAANGRNPIAIVIPCHRVIGASGALTGYGGGLDRKVWLLEHERRVQDGSAESVGATETASSLFGTMLSSHGSRGRIEYQTLRLGVRKPSKSQVRMLGRPGLPTRATGTPDSGSTS
jgi:methylated-DNA-[protein]-cysteine S-methyltransferase